MLYVADAIPAMVQCESYQEEEKTRVVAEGGMVGNSDTVVNSPGRATTIYRIESSVSIWIS